MRRRWRVREGRGGGFEWRVNCLWCPCVPEYVCVRTCFWPALSWASTATCSLSAWCTPASSTWARAFFTRRCWAFSTGPLAACTGSYHIDVTPNHTTRPMRVGPVRAERFQNSTVTTFAVVGGTWLRWRREGGGRDSATLYGKLMGDTKFSPHSPCAAAVGITKSAPSAPRPCVAREPLPHPPPFIPHPPPLHHACIRT